MPGAAHPQPQENQILAALPPAEREQWRRLLDYYVFGGEAAVAHIPEHRRGVLGPQTPEVVEKLKEGARQNL